MHAHFRISNLLTFSRETNSNSGPLVHCAYMLVLQIWDKCVQKTFFFSRTEIVTLLCEIAARSLVCVMNFWNVIGTNVRKEKMIWMIFARIINLLGAARKSLSRPNSRVHPRNTKRFVSSLWVGMQHTWHFNRVIASGSRIDGFRFIARLCGRSRFGWSSECH